MNISIQMKGDLLKKLPSIGQKALKELQAGVIKASTLLMEDAVQNAPSSTGTLRRGIRREIFGGGLSATIFPTSDYAVRLHGDGVKKRSAPFTIPGKEALPGGTLYRWAKKKGINPWAVRGAIKKKGMALNPWMFETSKKDEKKVEEIFRGTLKNVAAQMAD